MTASHLLSILPCLVPTALSAANLITNGDFADGSYTYEPTWPNVIYTNAGFTSDYASHDPDGGLYQEGSYAIGADPHLGDTNFLDIDDHSGDGNMLIVNGAVGEAALHDVVWQQALPSITPDTTYEFVAWLTNINNPESWSNDLAAWKASQAILIFQADFGDGWTPIGNPIDLTDPGVDSTVWNQFDFQWNSGAATSAAVRLVNMQTAANGNDFAMDGLSLQAIPEPSTMLAVIGSAFLLLRRRRA